MKSVGTATSGDSGLDSFLATVSVTPTGSSASVVVSAVVEGMAVVVWVMFRSSSHTGQQVPGSIRGFSQANGGHDSSKQPVLPS